MSDDWETPKQGPWGSRARASTLLAARHTGDHRAAPGKSSRPAPRLTDSSDEVIKFIVDFHAATVATSATWSERIERLKGRATAALGTTKSVIRLVGDDDDPSTRDVQKFR
jgi:hypothetical protein